QVHHPHTVPDRAAPKAAPLLVLFSLPSELVNVPAPVQALSVNAPAVAIRISFARIIIGLVR
ncbi:MAG: hypothetical protein ACPGVS_06755, partial [Primorskyibacter sp.]